MVAPELFGQDEAAGEVTDPDAVLNIDSCEETSVPTHAASAGAERSASAGAVAWHSSADVAEMRAGLKERGLEHWVTIRAGTASGLLGGDGTEPA